MQTPEQQAAEILILEGFAEPEELEPEMAELLKRIAATKKRIIRLWLEGEE